ncbi:MAG: cytochrome c [Pseudomonadota bacterium]|nr:cytochrome c [Pseudomonadota bacterium]
MKRALRAALLLAMCPLLACAKEIRLPDDGLEWQASALPGYAIVQAQCRGCHSAHYAAYQPPTSPRAYWEAQVKRMKAVFKAGLPDGQVAPVVDYLVKTYGAEAQR